MEDWDSFDDFAEFDPLTTIMIMITNATLTLFDPAQRGILIKNCLVEILFLYIPKCMLGTLETTFHGQTTFRLVGDH